MNRRRGRKPEYQLRIARERIALLLDETEKAKENSGRARRYVMLARKIGMRYNLRMPREFKRKYCKRCYNLLLDSKRRLKGGMLVVVCKHCCATTRYPYKNNK